MEKEPFIPLEGKKVRWYTCGPTVYDVAHMGHARAYLTFDILRRIMVGYFGYEVNFQVNITDIDDKIILRSRQNKLFGDFLKQVEGKSFEQIRSIAEEAMVRAERKLLAKAPAAPPPDAAKRELEDYEKRKDEHSLKLKQHEELKLKVGSSTNAKSVLEAARDPIMAKIDQELGHTVCDNAVFDAHARRYEDEYFEDMDALGVLRPDVVTRISEYMLPDPASPNEGGRVQRFIERLVDQGFCYESNGSVYFSIDTFRERGYNYRKLKPAANTTKEEMEEGEGALAAEETEKRHPNDFAVWKKSKPGEPSWESKWGRGRPGWHIECSVMATDINGEFLDVHGGGEDLKFPHHDNEMAQSEAYLGRPQWTNYWWHAGHLHIEGLKMSKSLKNFITIRQALSEHSARQLRLMFLMQQWDRGMNYSDQAIDMARAEERKLKHFLGSLKFHLRFPHSQGEVSERETSLAALVESTEEAIGAALRDNFSTSKVVNVISKLVDKCYASYEALPAAHLAPVSRAAALVERTMGVLGVENLVVSHDKEANLTPALDAYASLRQDVRKLAKEKASAEEVIGRAEAASSAAAAARSAGLVDCASSLEAFVADLKSIASTGCKPPDLMKRCDDVRDRDFSALGVRLEDLGADGFLWMLEDPQALAKELREQLEQKAAAGRRKLENKVAEKQRELKAAEKASVRPEDLFRNGQYAGMYSAFDESGIPTTLASGDAVSEKKKKDLKKELTKQQKDFEKLEKQAGKIGVEGLIAKLRQEITDLEKQL